MKYLCEVIKKGFEINSRQTIKKKNTMNSIEISALSYFEFPANTFQYVIQLEEAMTSLIYTNEEDIQHKRFL